MTRTPLSFTIFVLLRSAPAWLALPRVRRNTLAEEAVAGALDGLRVVHRHFDAEAFTARCTDVALFETDALGDFYVVMERLRDSALLAEPYFELVEIIPSIADGYRRLDAQEGAGDAA